MKSNNDLAFGCEVAAMCVANAALKETLLQAAKKLRSDAVSVASQERVVNEICEDGSPQSEFTLYLLTQWKRVFNEEMAVMIGQKAQEIYGAGAAAGGESRA